MRTPASKKLPATFEVQLATLVDTAPGGASWVHEIKLDGYRLIARVQAHGKRTDVNLFTRNGLDWSERVPTLRAALAELPVTGAALDGELCSLKPDGVSSFQDLQNALSAGREAALVYFAFDLLWLDGEDLRPLPLLERKARLAALLDGQQGSIRYSDHVVGDGPRFFARASDLKLEGIISKRAESTYKAGRSKDWLKVKCIARQEFVIGGYTPPGGSRTHLGALLVGVREGSGLRYAGKVGTGFSQASLRELHAALKPLECEQPPFENPPRGAAVRGARWVEPRLVAEIAFTEFTSDGRLRHPSFQGLREDKPAKAVIRERPKK
jgi:bifunctional non-homologous end joining protein LigD